MAGLLPKLPIDRIIAHIVAKAEKAVSDPFRWLLSS